MHPRDMEEVARLVNAVLVIDLLIEELVDELLLLGVADEDPDT